MNIATIDQLEENFQELATQALAKSQLYYNVSDGYPRYHWGDSEEGTTEPSIVATNDIGGYFKIVATIQVTEGLGHCSMWIVDDNNDIVTYIEADGSGICEDPVSNLRSEVARLEDDIRRVLTKALDERWTGQDDPAVVFDDFWDSIV